MTATPDKPKPLRGFASMSAERLREVAAKGGASVPAHKRSFSQDRTLASDAGRKGGAVSVEQRHPQFEPRPPNAAD